MKTPATLWRDMDRNQLEQEYSPSSAVGGDYAPFIKQYHTLSARARERCRDRHQVIYGAKPANSIDLLLPENRPAPLLVFIHGGYWQEGCREDSLFGAQFFVQQGIAYAAIGYTLTPLASLSEIVCECREALGVLKAQAETLRIDPHRIYLAGSSAGAHLCAMCGINNDSLAGLVLLSGVFELEPLLHTSINDAVGMDLQQALSLSPQVLDIHTFPPAIVSWGEIETSEFKRQSQFFAERLRGIGCLQQEFESPLRNHFDIVHDLSNFSSPLGRSVLELIRSTS